MERLKVSIDLKYDEEERWQSKKLPNTIQVSASNLPELNWASQQVTQSSGGGGGSVGATHPGPGNTRPPQPSATTPPHTTPTAVNEDLARLAAMSAGFASMQMRPVSTEAMSRHAVLATQQSAAAGGHLQPGVGGVLQTSTSGRSMLYPDFDASMPPPVEYTSLTPTITSSAAAAAAVVVGHAAPPFNGVGGVGGVGEGAPAGQAAFPSAPPLPETVQVVVPPTATGTDSVAELLSMAATVPPTLQLGPQEMQVCVCCGVCWGVWGYICMYIGM